MLIMNTSTLTLHYLADWTSPAGDKKSHATEGVAPKTRGRKGQNAPDPRKARRPDASDRWAREADHEASEWLRAHGTEEDARLADQYVSRWGSVPEVITFDRGLGASVLIDSVSEGDRPMTLDRATETRVATIHEEDCRSVRRDIAASAEYQEALKMARNARANGVTRSLRPRVPTLPCSCRKVMTRAWLQGERTDRERTMVRDESGRVIEVRHLEPRSATVKVKVLDGDPSPVVVKREGGRDVITLTLAGTDTDRAPRSVRVTRKLPTITWHGNDKGTRKEAATDKARKASQRAAKRAVDPAATLAAALKGLTTVGESLTWQTWRIEVASTSTRGPRLTARTTTRPGNVVGTPSQVAKAVVNAPLGVDTKGTPSSLCKEHSHH